MRFVYGSDHAANTVAARLAATATSPAPARLPSPREVQEGSSGPARAGVAGR
jgi:hypothetical protein